MVVESEGKVVSGVNGVNLQASMGDGTMNNRVNNGNNNNAENTLQSELELMLRQRHNRPVYDPERDVNVNRSGSAPPTVEGSLNAVGSILRNSNFVQTDQNRISSGGGGSGVFLTEDELRSHPDYLRYYYSLVNLNPRLPPPLLSKEVWRVAQRFQGGGSSFDGAEDRRGKDSVNDHGGSSLFSMDPRLAIQKAAEDELIELRKAISARSISRNSSSDRLSKNSDGLVGRSGSGMGVRRKSFADILQEGLDRSSPSSAPSSGRLSRSVSRSSLGDATDTKGVSHSVELGNRKGSSEALHTGAAAADLPRSQNLGPAVPESVASSASSSQSRSRTPEPLHVGGCPPPGFPPVSGRASPAENKKIVDMNLLNSLSMSELADLAASLSGLNLSRSRLRDEDNFLQSQIPMRFDKPNNYLAQVSNTQRQSLQQQFIDSLKADKLGINSNNVDFVRENGSLTNLNVSKQGKDGKGIIPRRSSSFADLRSNLNSFESATLEGSKINYQDANYPAMEFSGHMSSGYSPEKLKVVVNNNLPTDTNLSAAGNGQNLRRSKSQAASDLRLPAVDPHHARYMLKTSDYATQAATSTSELPRPRSDLGISQGHGDLLALQKAYIEALLAQQKQQYASALFGRSDSSNHPYFGNPAFDLAMSYQGNPSVLPSLGSRPLTQNELTAHVASTPKISVGGSTGSCSTDGKVPSSLLEEVKNNKTKAYALSDVVDHVIEFSTDQYGSRFIQQKLETATVEEKMIIFKEIFPHARALMTDVFGNYVIQKFFEHGTETQRKELASQLIGHVLPLSLQMYGCRVIQKALEVVDLQLQTQMVKELDGSIMKCVRDQNGNHVIQKCIECVPQDRIHFIVSSFFGQVVSLSSHPYGCRVIQRVLEHCDDPKTQYIVMEEIMNAVCTLAQDQYGNYVIQHVLQHGKPHERSAVIGKLAGQIIKMSQQKFASNVVEKCLTFGGPEERQLLVKEMLGSTDENEPLQAMMKDPFGNYVVQKVLETCDDKSRELILSRIKVHLAALKRYTYGKHIVSRVEKLLTSGERRTALSTSRST